MQASEDSAAHEFATATDIEPLALMEGLRVRPVSGERVTLAIFELDPGTAMPEHLHPNEQVGVVVRGEFTFTIGGETRLRKPGDMWVIPPTSPTPSSAPAPPAARSSKPSHRLAPTGLRSRAPSPPPISGRPAES